MLFRLLSLALGFGQIVNPVHGPLPPNLNIDAGAPGYESPGCELLIRQGYACLVSSKYRDPLWSQEHLATADLAPPQYTRPKPEPFKSDPDLPEDFLAKKSDYKKSGYDRGHMACSADLSRHSLADPTHPRSVQSESYYLSNMVPQNGPLNQKLWRHFEDKLRSLVPTYGEMQIITGPVFSSAHPQTIGAGHVAVPDAVFKIAVVTQGSARGTWYAVVVPNKNPGAKVLSKFLTTIGKVEDQIGLKFFTNWPDAEQTKLKSGGYPKMPIPATFK